MSVYYANLSFDDGYCQLFNDIAHVKLSVCALLSFLQATSNGLTITFKSDTRLGLGVFHLVVMLALVVNFVDIMIIRPIVDCLSYDIFTLLMFQFVIK